MWFRSRPRYLAFAFFFRSLTPGPPPFSAMNSTAITLNAVVVCARAHSVDRHDLSILGHSFCFRLGGLQNELLV